MAAQPDQRTLGSAPTVTGPASRAERFRRDGIAVVAVALCALVGETLWFSNSQSVVLMLAPVAGIIAAMLACGPVWAAADSAAGALIGTGLCVMLTPSGNAAALLANASGYVLSGMLIAGAVAAVASWALRIKKLTSGLLCTVALALILAAACSLAVQLASIPRSTEWIGLGSAGRLTLFQAFETQPVVAPGLSDDGIFLASVKALSRGEDYYVSSIRVLAGYDTTHSFPLNSPWSYRLPTLYALLAALPQKGVWFVGVSLALTAVATLAAFALASRLSNTALGVVAATGVATFFAVASAVGLALQSELWAGAAVLVSAACYLNARRGSRHRARLLLAAAVAATLAALFRELAAPVLLLGLCSTLLEPEARLARYWAPWLIGMLLVLAAYAAHAASLTAAYTQVRSSLPPETSGRTFFHPDGLGVTLAMYEMRRLLAVDWVLPWLVLAASSIGVLLARMRPGERLFVAGVALGGPLVQLVIRTSGMTGYWADIYIPLLLTCAPLALAPLLPRPEADILGPSSERMVRTSSQTT